MALNTVDEDRVAVFGGSYGGYSAYCQVLKYPELYDAGIAWMGMTDLEGLYEETMPNYRTEMLEYYLGTPDENPELYHERSPINHADSLSCPLLILHGENDSRIPINQAERFRNTLIGHGYEEGPEGDLEYKELSGEGHGSTVLC